MIGNHPHNIQKLVTKQPQPFKRRVFRVQTFHSHTTALFLRPHANWTQRDAEKMEPGPILLLVASCIAYCEQSVASIGVAGPNFLHFWRSVWCAWGLMNEFPGLLLKTHQDSFFNVKAIVDFFINVCVTCGKPCQGLEINCHLLIEKAGSMEDHTGGQPWRKPVPTNSWGETATSQPQWRTKTVLTSKYCRVLKGNRKPGKSDLQKEA